MTVGPVEEPNDAHKSKDKKLPQITNESRLGKEDGKRGEKRDAEMNDIGKGRSDIRQGEREGEKKQDKKQKKKKKKEEQNAEQARKKRKVENVENFLSKF